MIVFEIMCLAALAVLIVAGLIVWFGVRDGLHVPYDDSEIQWPIDHPMHRAWVKRVRDEK
jgi:hypothetical protein